MTAPATLACPRCATPLVSLAPGAAVGRVAVKCTRCGHWLELDQGAAAPAPGSAPPAAWPPAPPPAARPAPPPPAGPGWHAPRAPGQRAADRAGWSTLLGPLSGTGRPAGLGLLDWLGAAAGLGGALVMTVLGVAMGQFRTMLSSLGGELPRLTAFVFSVRLPYLLAALAAGLAVAGLVVRARGLPLGRPLLAAAVAVVLLGAPLCLISFYLPIFSMADAVK